MQYLLRLTTYIRPYGTKLSFGFATMLLATVLTMGSPFLVKWAIDAGLNPSATGFDGSKTTLILAASGLIAFAIGRGLAQFGQTYISMSVAESLRTTSATTSIATCSASATHTTTRFRPARSCLARRRM